MVAELDLVTNKEHVKCVQMESKEDVLTKNIDLVCNTKEKIIENEKEKFTTGEKSIGKINCNDTYLDLNSSLQKEVKIKELEKEPSSVNSESEKSCESEIVKTNEVLIKSESLRALEYEQMILLLETELLTENESAINANLVQLYEETFQSLKDWNEELRVREDFMMEQYLKQSEFKDESDGNELNTEGKSRSGSDATDDLLDEAEQSKMLLTIAPKEKENMNANSVIQDETEQSIEALEIKSDEQKENILGEPWTTLKVQKLLDMQYNRCERFRLALVDQKKYLAMVAAGRLPHFDNIACKQRLTFKVAGLIVISIIRLQKMLNEYKDSMKLIEKPKVKKRKRRNMTKEEASSETETSDDETRKSSDKEEPILSIISGGSLKSFEYAQRNGEIKPKEVDCTLELKELSDNNENTKVDHHSNESGTIEANDAPISFKPTSDSPKSYPRLIESPTNTSWVTTHDVTATPIVCKSPQLDYESTQKTSPKGTPKHSLECSIDLDHSIIYDFEEESSFCDLYMETIDALQDQLKKVGFYNGPS